MKSWSCRSSGNKTYPKAGVKPSRGSLREHLIERSEGRRVGLTKRKSMGRRLSVIGRMMQKRRLVRREQWSKRLESSEGLEARCNIEDLRKLDRKQPDQVGKVFRVAGYARMHRQMRSSENSARTPVDRSDLSLPRNVSPRCRSAWLMALSWKRISFTS